MIQEKQNQKVDYKVKSNKKCCVCGIPLKQTLVNKNPHAKMCFNCFKISKGKTEQRIHKIIHGEKVLIKVVDRLKVQKENKRFFLGAKYKK